MKSAVAYLTVIACCFFCFLSVATISNRNLLQNEVEHAATFAVQQTLRKCDDECITDPETISIIVTNTFASMINSKKGNIVLYVICAEKNIVSVSAELSYTQLDGSTKTYTVRKTCIRDWQTSDAGNTTIRYISKDFANSLSSGSIWNTSDYRPVLDNALTSHGYIRKAQIR